MIDWQHHVIAPTVDVFGQPAIYHSQSGTAYPITGVFDEAYYELKSIDNDTVSVGSVSPVLGICAAALPITPQQNDQLTINNQRYRIKKVQQDGHGHILLLLNYAPQENTPYDLHQT